MDTLNRVALLDRRLLGSTRTLFGVNEVDTPAMLHDIAQAAVSKPGPHVVPVFASRGAAIIALQANRPRAQRNSGLDRVIGAPGERNRRHIARVGTEVLHATKGWRTLAA